MCPLDVQEAIRKRRSIRKYRSKPIPNEKLQLLLEAARLAPSGGNRQPWRFVVVKKPSTKRALAQATHGYQFIADAGVIVAALGDPQASPRWFKQDPMTAVVLTATSLGLGTCWVGGFDEDEVKRVLKIPETLAVVVLLPIGVPDESPPARSRKPIEEIAFLEEYGRPLVWRE